MYFMEQELSTNPFGDPLLQCFDILKYMAIHKIKMSNCSYAFQNFQLIKKNNKKQK